MDEITKDWLLSRARDLDAQAKAKDEDIYRLLDEAAGLRKHRDAQVKLAASLRVLAEPEGIGIAQENAEG